MFKKFIQFVGKTDSLEIGWLLIYLASFSYSRETLATELIPTLGIANLLRMFFVSSSLLIVFFHLLKKIPYPQFNAVWLFLLYVCICIVSTVWSVSQVKTFGKILEVLAPTLIVLICASKPNAMDRLRRLFDWYIIILSVIVMTHVIGLFVAPDIFIHTAQGHGIESKYFGSNAISVYAAIVAVVCISRWGEAVYLQVQTIRGISKGYYLFGYLIFFPLCVFGHGRTAMGIAVITSILVFFRLKLTFPRMLLAISIPLVALSFTDQIIEYLYRGQDLDAIKGLSGRVALIEFGLPFVYKNPIFGYGFGVGSDYVFHQIGASGLGDFGITISSLHNGVLEVLLGTGMLGLIVLSMSMLKSFWAYARGYVRGRDLDMAMISIYIIAYTFVSGLGVGGWMSNIIGFYLLSSAILSWDVQKRTAKLALEKQI
jgi:O-antigen ligase